MTNLFRGRDTEPHLSLAFRRQVVTADDDPFIIAVGQRTASVLNDLNSYAPMNGLCLSWPPAAALATRQSATELLRGFSAAYARTANVNGWPELNGGGLEQIGAMEALHLLMLRVGREGDLSVFPAWPADGPPASFTRLRARGAFVVSASWNGGGQDSHHVFVS